MPITPSPYDTPTVCSSNLYWDKMTVGWNMAPGEPCVACHMKYPGTDATKYLSFAGTVYKTAHEPDDCYGVGHSDLTEGPATIEITGLRGLCRGADRPERPGPPLWRSRGGPRRIQRGGCPLAALG